MTDFKKPASISIYPKNFESKEKVIHFLDTYNHKMEKDIRCPLEYGLDVNVNEKVSQSLTKF